MKLPTNIILLIILILLVLASWGYQGPYQKWQHQRNLPYNFMQLKGEINKIEIEGAKGKVTLDKEGELWRVKGQEGKFYASPVQMKPISETLNNLGDIELEVASNNPDKQADFLVAGPEALKIVLKSDKAEAKFNVGKATQNFSGSYVSRDKDTKTYRLKSVNLRQLLEREEWRDYSLFNLDLKKVESLRLQYPDHETKMSLRDDQWVKDDGKVKYDKEQVEKIATTLVGLMAVEIPKQDFKPTGLAKPAMIIQFKGEGFDETLMLGAKGPQNTYYAKRGNSDNIYLISNADFETLTQKENNLVAKTDKK